MRDALPISFNNETFASLKFCSNMNTLKYRKKLLIKMSEAHSTTKSKQIRLRLITIDQFPIIPVLLIAYTTTILINDPPSGSGEAFQSSSDWFVCQVPR